jgi:glucose-6-phosphate isomerase
MSTLSYNNLDATEAYNALKQYQEPVDLSALLDAERIRHYSIPTGGGLQFNFAAKPVHEDIISLLQELADEQQLIPKYQAILRGEIMNPGENRMVLHHLTRGQLGEDVFHNHKNLRRFYVEQQNRIYEFARKVHTGQIKGSTGKTFDTVVQVGIGGSDLGPRALYLALKNLALSKDTLKMTGYFISNVDPDDANAILANLDYESTLFIIVSKSGTTQETLTNRALIVEKMKQSGIDGLDPRKHMIAVTSETSPMASSDEYLESFFIDDFIGGRYSSTSAVGGTILSLTFGGEVFSEILAGAHETDNLSLNTSVRENASLMDGLIGIYERNILGLPCTAVLPYSQALERFPAHLQQLDMESNGKRVNRRGEAIHYKTGPILFGEPGTNGQHSFYQLLHQGTDYIPLQFIGFSRAQTAFDVTWEGSTSQTKLVANLAAQIVAFALGKDDKNANKYFPGNRPSSVIHGENLTPKALGALLAHFENKVMFQGLAWNINSYDQEGVQLGKVLTKQILSGKSQDEIINTYARILGIAPTT